MAAKASPSAHEEEKLRMSTPGYPRVFCWHHVSRDALMVAAELAAEAGENDCDREMLLSVWKVGGMEEGEGRVCELVGRSDCSHV